MSALHSTKLISDLVASARRVTIAKLFRPDRILQALAIFADAAFAVDMASMSDYDLQSVVAHEVGPAHPIALASVAGYDASYRVDNLCRQNNATCTSVAMGSTEGFTLANQAIANAARTGTWVLLKNVHLAPTWLAQLEKRLHALSPSAGFRLFLTMETNPVIPVNILRQSRIIMNEPPPGVRANLLDTLRGIPQSRLQSGPAEKARLYFLLSWFHAVVQERLRYLPIGWSKGYEFNDSDFDTAVITIDSWLSALAKGKANVDPAQIPWQALRTLIKQAVYGGRVDSDYDQRVVDAFVDRIFTAKAYDPDFALVDSLEDSVTIPDGTQLSHFIDWTTALPEREPPGWLSLPKTAESLVAAAEGKPIHVEERVTLPNGTGEAMVTKLRKMRTTEDEEDGTGSLGSSDAARPSWMVTLKSQAESWLRSLPESLSSPTVADSPLTRYFAREVSTGKQLLGRIRKDLSELVEVCSGSVKQTNESRSLMSDLNQGMLWVPR